jgi:hypothetical protein
MASEILPPSGPGIFLSRIFFSSQPMIGKENIGKENEIRKGGGDF